MIGKTISHYNILEKLGEGGMGIVYKAEDTTLKRAVALKFLPPEMTRDPQANARFLHEARAAAALNHPNICTVYEIGEADGQTFIAMALIEGGSLRDRIGRGPLRLDETFELAVQVAQGLAAAHKKNIVHRDMKPGNVMVTTEGRPKIMDFGLAKSPGQTRLTRAGTTTGTIAYMSPEQSRGEHVDHRTDIWSFGVMLYEMITGQRPFRGDYEQAVVHSIVNEEPEPVTALRTGVPMELERIVVKAMAKRPEERYQTVPDMLVDLKALGKAVHADSATSATIVRPLPKPASLRAGRRRTAAIVAVLAIVALATTFVMMRPRGPSVELDASRVLVAAFENRTGDESLDPLGTMLADWFTEGVSEIGEYDVVSWSPPGSRAATAETEGLDDATRLRSVAREAGAGTIISGSYYAEGANLRFQIRLADASDGSIIYAPPAVTGLREAPTDALETLRQRMMGALVTEFDPSLRAQPPIYEAYREYSTGMRLFAADYTECIRHLSRAIEIDPSFTSARLHLAIAYGNIGHRAEADSVMSEVVSNREKLTPFEQQLLGWYVAKGRSDHEASLRHLSEARKLNPTSVLATYVHALTSLYVNRPWDTLETLEALEWMGESEAAADRVHHSWPSLLGAIAHHLLGDHNRELQVAREGLEYYPNLPLLRATEVGALAALHHVEEVRDIVDQSLATVSEYGSPYWVMESAFLELRAHGHLAESIEIANRAVDWCRGRPEEEAKTEELRASLAYALYAAERWDETEALFEELARESPESIDYAGYLGTLAARRGDLEEAVSISTQLEHLDRQHMNGVNMYWCACISSLLDEKERAVEFLRKGFAEGLRHAADVDLHTEMDFESLRSYPPFEELMRPKR